MIWAIRQLLVPLNYLRIRHGAGFFHSKKMYDFVMPIGLALASVGAFWWLNIPFALSRHPHLVKSLTDLLILMIVFYMAALAAVATFERTGIDERLPDEDAILWKRKADGGQWYPKPLSYRQFISYLFGYLSFLSLCLYFAVEFVDVAWNALEKHFAGNGNIHWIFVSVADPIILFLTFAALWQLFVTSLLGIYFLTERIQTLNEPKDSD